MKLTSPLCFLLFVLCVIAQTGQWKRTKCGNFADLVTEWGLKVDPKNPILPEYPRPQLVRPDSTYQNLNGLWGFQPASPNDLPPFGKTLPQSILVPFPVESCLSGIGQTHKYLWYRLVFNLNNTNSERTLLHFGAVDWQTKVWVNRREVGTHTGGYDPFTFDITSVVEKTNNELIVYVYDPSDEGFQPNGKQRISAINNPGGDTYTPSSGIWQTVWVEYVPNQYVESLKITADTKTVTVSANVPGSTVTVTYKVMDGNAVVATGSGSSNTAVKLTINSPKLWSPSNPFLYGLSVSIPSETVTSYFGMRTFELVDEMHPATPDTGPQVGVDRPGDDLPGYPVRLQSDNVDICWGLCNQTAACQAWAYEVINSQCTKDTKPLCWLKGSDPGHGPNSCRISGAKAQPRRLVKRPHFNGEFLFLAGWLDQSWWPDGQYTAPSEEALLFDLQSVKTFGLNVVRLHQKVNPARWYYHADRLGIVILQDMIQKYGGATSATVDPFLSDLKAMITGLYNHPCIVQWTVFNEGDCVGSFDVPTTVKYAQSLDSTRLFDTDSGGPANNLYIANVNDIHSYPWPGHPIPSATQYAMIGEYGGIGAFVSGHEWVPNKCDTYLHVNTPQDEANTYINMTQQIVAMRLDLSVCIYTQITDVERECDGFLNYDRTNKFNSQQTMAIRNANSRLIQGTF